MNIYITNIGRFLHKSFTNSLFIVVFLTAISAYIPGGNIQAQGGLLLTPKRVLFDGNKTSENINLANSGNDTARYVISLTHFRMNADGSFEEISASDAAQFSAEPYLRYFPKTVVLAPNEAQVIRVQFNKPAQMASGEYRSHFYVRAVPKPSPLGGTDKEVSASIDVKLVPVFGVSIPVIIRIGESNTTATITGLSLKTSATEPQQILSLALNRSGNMSLYGDIAVKHIAPNGQSRLVGSIKGIAVYTPNPTRLITLALDKTVPVDYHSGKLVVEFIARSNEKDKKMGEAELVLQ